jgi:Chromosome segregation ATPases
MSANDRASNLSWRGTSKGSQLSEGLIRSELEKEYNQRYTQLRNLYEMRIQAMQDSLKNAFKLVQGDELIETMKNDATSEEFINQRVKEIIEEVLYNEREVLIEKLSQQHALLRTEFIKLEQEHNRLIDEYKEMETELTRKLEEIHHHYETEIKNREFFESEVQTLRKNIQEITQNYEDTIKRREEQWNTKSQKDASDLGALKEKLNAVENNLKRSQEEIEEYKKQLNNQKNKLAEKDYEIHTLKLDKNTLENRIKDSDRHINDLEGLKGELKRTIQDLNDQINQLKAEILHGDQVKQAVEERLKKQIDEMNKVNTYLNFSDFKRTSKMNRRIKDKI